MAQDDFRECQCVGGDCGDWAAPDSDFCYQCAPDGGTCLFAPRNVEMRPGPPIEGEETQVISTVGMKLDEVFCFNMDSLGRELVAAGEDYILGNEKGRSIDEIRNEIVRMTVKYHQQKGIT